MGDEGARGWWGVAKSLAGPNASNEDIKRIQLELQTANPGVTVLRRGQTVNIGDGSISSAALRQDAALDAVYQAQQQAKAAARAPNPSASLGSLVGADMFGDTARYLAQHPGALSQGTADRGLFAALREGRQWMQQRVNNPATQSPVPFDMRTIPMGEGTPQFVDPIDMAEQGWDAAKNITGAIAHGVVQTPLQFADLALVARGFLSGGDFDPRPYYLSDVGQAVNNGADWVEAQRVAATSNPLNMIGNSFYLAADAGTHLREGNVAAALGDTALWGLNLLGAKAGAGVRVTNGLTPYGTTVADEIAALNGIGVNTKASQNLNQRINAKSIQVESGYNADLWLTGRLNEGDVVYSLSPNRKPEFFTTLQTLQAGGFDSAAVSRIVQVKEHSQFGYRPDITGYRVKQSFDLPYGRANANPQFGSGGGEQYLIFDYKKYLEPITTIDLKRK